MNSLERSLQLGLAVSLLLLTLLFWWAGSLASRLLVENLVLQRLEAGAGDLIDALSADGGNLALPAADDARVHPDYRHAGSGRYFIVREQGGKRLRSASADGQPGQVPTMAPGQQRKRRIVGKGGQPMLMWIGGYARGGRAYTLAIVENVSPIEARLVVFHWYLAGSALVLLVALLAVQRLIVRGSLRRLEGIRQDITRLEHGQTAALSESVPDEIRPLVEEFNRLLVRFDKRLRQSRNALGNLAHTLKGPLNLLLRASEADDADSGPRRREIAQNAERIHQLIESELKRARLAGRSSAGRLFDLDTELPTLSGLLRQVYSDKAVDIRYLIGPNVTLYHDRQDMLELIGNLLDNAVKWASGVVIVQVRMVRGVIIDVEDDGPGCSPEDIERLTDRGVRLDESVAGHGLGLSIVKDIVEIYEGRLLFERSRRLGGLRASVYLPAIESGGRSSVLPRSTG